MIYSEPVFNRYTTMSSVPFGTETKKGLVALPCGGHRGGEDLGVGLS